MKKSIYLSLLFLVFACDKKAERSMNQEMSKKFIDLSSLDIRLNEPKPMDWLYQHEEKGQTFEQYKLRNPVQPTQKVNCLYIQPIGKFSSSEQKVLNLNKEYLNIFFNLKVVVLDSLANSTIPNEKKRVLNGREQFDASFIINNILPDILPNDGIVIMAITAKDLYPKPEWNYAFGLANLNSKTSITSICRFTEANFDAIHYQTCLSRLIKTSSHEICHMFGMKHCINAVCLMNGSNTLEEIDRCPNALCSECLQKLTWNLALNNPERLSELITFFNTHQLNSDSKIVQAQLSVLIK